MMYSTCKIIKVCKNTMLPRVRRKCQSQFEPSNITKSRTLIQIRYYFSHNNCRIRKKFKQI